jgi:DNA-binding IclR family transcriptional regulator
VPLSPTITSTVVGTSSRYRNQATQRVLNLLLMFVGPEETRGVSELSRASGMNKNMVHRALATLVDAGYVVRDRSGERYQLGYRILDLHLDDGILDLRALCRPTLEQLHAVTRESVFLSIIVGRNRVNVDWIEALGRRVSFGQRGRSVPLHCTKMSRLLLAHLDDAEIESYLAGAAPLDQFDALFPDTAVTTEASVWHEIRAMRGADYVTWRSPKQFGGAYVSFPIPGADGRLHAIVTIGGPMERFDPERIVRLNAIWAAVEQLRQQCLAFVPAPVVVADGAQS